MSQHSLRLAAGRGKRQETEVKEIDENAGGENDAGGEENEKEMQVTAAETNAGNRRAGAGALQVLCFRKHFKFPF